MVEYLELFNNPKIGVYFHDSKDMGELENNSIDLIVTSPPYWDLKNYNNHHSQIGLGQSYNEYISNLEDILKECVRVLKNGRFFVINVGTRISDGELRHIPMDVTKILKNLNLKLKKEVIWKKPKGTQGLWQRGTTQFLKRKPYPLMYNLNIQHEYILFFQKGNYEMIEKERLSEDFIKKVAWSVWEMKVSRTKGHPAPFPLELPLQVIKLMSFEKETVLDPFVGSGTTLEACLRLNRNGIGYEINEEYKDLILSIKKRIPIERFFASSE